MKRSRYSEIFGAVELVAGGALCVTQTAEPNLKFYLPLSGDRSRTIGGLLAPQFADVEFANQFRDAARRDAEKFIGDERDVWLDATRDLTM